MLQEGSTTAALLRLFRSLRPRFAVLIREGCRRFGEGLVREIFGERMRPLSTRERFDGRSHISWLIKLFVGEYLTEARRGHVQGRRQARGTDDLFGEIVGEHSVIRPLKLAQQPLGTALSRALKQHATKNANRPIRAPDGHVPLGTFQGDERIGRVNGLGMFGGFEAFDHTLDHNIARVHSQKYLCQSGRLVLLSSAFDRENTHPCSLHKDGGIGVDLRQSVQGGHGLTQLETGASEPSPAIMFIGVLGEARSKDAACIEPFTASDELFTYLKEHAVRWLVDQQFAEQVEFGVGEGQRLLRNDVEGLCLDTRRY